LRFCGWPHVTVAWVFPGQGSQHVGMAMAWREASDCAREALDEATDGLGFDLVTLMRDGPADQLDETAMAQPAIFAASIAILRATVDTLPPPAVVAGHSMGELSALVAASALGFPDGLRLVQERGRLMRLAGEVEPGRMAAVLGLSDDVVAQACDAIAGVQVANYNAPGQVVISGQAAAVESASAALLGAGAKRVLPLAVSIAAHSQLMAPIAGEFARAVDATHMEAPAVPIVMNRTAEPTTDLGVIRSALGEQLTSPVQWSAAVQRMREDGVDLFLEIGPGNVLTGLIRRIGRDLPGPPIEVRSLATPAGLESGPKQC
jgi:[acyl-carrier-protein] S-malonyltransferase